MLTAVTRCRLNWYSEQGSVQEKLHPALHYYTMPILCITQLLKELSLTIKDNLTLFLRVSVLCSENGENVKKSCCTTLNECVRVSVCGCGFGCESGAEGGGGGGMRACVCARNLTDMKHTCPAKMLCEVLLFLQFLLSFAVFLPYFDCVLNGIGSEDISWHLLCLY